MSVLTREVHWDAEDAMKASGIFWRSQLVFLDTLIASVHDTPLSWFQLEVAVSNWE